MPRRPRVPGISVEEMLARQPIFWTDTSVTALVAPAPSGPLHTPVRLHAATDLARAYGDVAGSPLGRAVTAFFDNGGRVALALRADDGRAAVACLEDADEFQLLTLDPSLTGQALTEAYALCERRKAFLLVDAEQGTPPPGLGANAAAYHPRLLDAAGDAWPASPAVAGMIARTDAQRGVWRSPAGTTAQLLGVADVAEHLTDRQLSDLTQRQVNGLRLMPDGTVVVWGARTLATDPQWRYVAVRRLFLFLEQTIQAGLAWVAAETSDEALWEQVRQDVSDFLTRLWREGAFPGDRPAEAFFVRCDRSTMTEDDVASGRVICLVGVAPIRPAEFVTLTVTGTAAGPER